MQKGHLLEFKCCECEKPVNFSLFALEAGEELIHCENCEMGYDFSDETLMRQLRKFDNLCRQIQASEEILSNTSIGIYLGDQEIKIPYKILLTRLNSTLDLKLGDRNLTITFRIEPILDLPKFIKS